MLLPGSSNNSNATITAHKSQSVLYGCLLLAALLFYFAFELLTKGYASGYIFAGFGGALILGVMLLWNLGRRDSELDGAQKTVLKTGDTSVELDARMTKDVGQVLQVLNTMANMRPLPIPNGIVDAAMNPVPGTGETSSKIVEEINAQTLSRKQEIAERFISHVSTDNARIVQQTHAEPVTPKLPQGGSQS